MAKKQVEQEPEEEDDEIEGDENEDMKDAIFQIRKLIASGKTSKPDLEWINDKLDELSDFVDNVG